MHRKYVFDMQSTFERFLSWTKVCVFADKKKPTALLFRLLKYKPNLVLNLTGVFFLLSIFFGNEASDSEHFYGKRKKRNDQVEMLFMRKKAQFVL